MYADIPFSWDKLPADGGSIGWTNATDRNNGYAGLAGPLDGFSIMTFSKDSFAAVETATDYERTGDFPNPARIAIPGKVGPTEATDIENRGFWHYSIETFGPIITSAPVISATGLSATNM